MDVVRVIISYLKFEQLIPFFKDHACVKFKYDGCKNNFDNLACLNYMTKKLPNMSVIGVSMHEGNDVSHFIHLQNVKIRDVELIKFVPAHILNNCRKLVVTNFDKQIDCEKIKCVKNITHLELHRCVELESLRGYPSSVTHLS